MMSGALSLITRNAQGGGNDARRLGFSPLPNRQGPGPPGGELAGQAHPTVQRQGT